MHIIDKLKNNELQFLKYETKEIKRAINDESPYPPFQHLPPPPPLHLPVANAISMFGNDKKVYLQSKWQTPTANWPLQSFIYFYSVIVFTAGQYS